PPQKREQRLGADRQPIGAVTFSRRMLIPYDARVNDEYGRVPHEPGRLSPARIAGHFFALLTQSLPFSKRIEILLHVVALRARQALAGERIGRFVFGGFELAFDLFDGLSFGVGSLDQTGHNPRSFADVLTDTRVVHFRILGLLGAFASGAFLPAQALGLAEHALLALFATRAAAV